jgi:hypothetical protein
MTWLHKMGSIFDGSAIECVGPFSIGLHVAKQIQSEDESGFTRKGLLRVTKNESKNTI